MTAKEAQRLVEMHGGYRAAERATGIDRKKLSGIINGKQGGAMATAKTAEKPVEQSNLMSVSDVIAPHDKVAGALKVITDIPQGKLMSDEALRKEVGVSDDKWRRVRGSVRLSGYWTVLPDKSMVWGSKQTVKTVADKIKEL